VIAGIILNVLPDGIRIGVNDCFLTPVTNAFIGFLSAISVPLIFLSVLGSICSMGNMETLGMINQKVLHEEDPNTNGIEHLVQAFC
ncbi:MAG: hypothetical protein IJ955_04125, partial [Oscillospiraceae bacterium]|nr:hypothetical protein [Oscillospiraceae bacterium]